MHPQGDDSRYMQQRIGYFSHLLTRSEMLRYLTEQGASADLIESWVYRAREVPAENQASWDPNYVGYVSVVAADLLLGFGREPLDG